MSPGLRLLVLDEVFPGSLRVPSVRKGSWVVQHEYAFHTAQAARRFVHYITQTHSPDESWHRTQHYNRPYHRVRVRYSIRDNSTMHWFVNIIERVTREEHVWEGVLGQAYCDAVRDALQRRKQ